MVRVRYAPSPTGLQHIGSVRTALFNYLFARSEGGAFVLRIEDTDRERFDPSALADIYDTFDWLGFRWDEGPDVGGPYRPYVQSERASLYRQFAQVLLDAGHAYLAYDSAEDLRASRETGDGRGGYDRRFRDMGEAEIARYRESGVTPVVRFRVPLEGTTDIDDMVLGPMCWENADVSPDPVLLKSDGMPTYHLANVVDDHHMGITHILRAQEWIPSAPLHVLLYRAFCWEPPRFCHLPMVVGEDGKKLSKRHGATRVLEFREQGYLPEALINYLARVGWSYDDRRELFTLAELEELFTPQKISRSPAVFDYRKLDSLNGHYIRERSEASLHVAILPFVQRAGLVSDPPSSEQENILIGALPLIRERLRVLSDAPDLLRYLFVEPTDYDAAQMIPKRHDAASTARLLEEVMRLAAESPEFTDEENEERFRRRAEELGTKLANLMMPLRVALTGSRVSPPLFGSIRLLGSERTLARAQRGLEKLRAL